jgi:signal transduction histidine kinase/pSer/pThr/pTyr-binding forkhead associated (FHA) protein
VRRFARGESGTAFLAECHLARLLVIKGADEGKQVELTGGPVTVGRDATNALRLHDTEVSRRHAEFRMCDGSWSLLDNGSANGSYVNNKKIVGEIALHPGDQILLGQTVLVFSGAGDQAADEAGDLAEKISLISRQDLELSSAIVKSIADTEGSRILAQPEQAKTVWLRTALANLAIMYEASQAVSHILDLNDLLQRILELVFRSIEADRGCVMLRNDGSGELEPKAVRWRRGGGSQDRIDVSRTIVDHVLREKQGVLLSDARQDERFNAGQSILRYGIREVICVPMTGRRESLGVLYLDTVSSARDLSADPAGAGGKFTEDHLALAIAVAHQAALAVEETRYHQAMVQAERLAAIGQTIAAVSHHIKNILQSLRSGGEILTMGIASKDDALLQQGWKMTEKAQGKIFDLVMDMLSYSKEREPVVEPTDLNALAREVLELIEPRAKELGVELDCNFEDRLPLLALDPEGIHRALLNVVGNALDAVEGRKNARVTVGTRRDPEEGWFRLLVLDNGVGIPPQQIHEIFKPFVSTKGARGTGLGLAVSRKILREHGGDILVQSQPGKGSKFILRLPSRSPLNTDSQGTLAEMPVFRPPES